MRKRYPQVKDMYADSIYTGSVNIDWREALGENGDGWTAWEADECDTCGAVVVLNAGQGDESHRDHDGTDCDGWIGLAEGPMMNYFYPLPSFGDDRREPLDDAKALLHLPLCLVQFEHGGYALALTGGGMDLSWEICEAFMRLGYLPPLKYCTDLPNMAGDTYKQRAYVLAGAARSCKIAAEWAKRGGQRIRERRRELRAAAKAVQA